MNNNKTESKQIIKDSYQENPANLKSNYLTADVIYWTRTKFEWEEKIKENMKNLFGIQ